jgi:U3 small nucleolar ribonucleoprotein protein IMP4
MVQELRLVFPNAQKLNRGNYVLKQLVETCRANEVTDLVLVHEHRGEPDGLVVCHLPYGPTAYFGISNAVLRHDLKVRNLHARIPPWRATQPRTCNRVRSLSL